MMSTNNQTKEEKEELHKDNMMMEEENSKGENEVEKMDEKEQNPDIQKLLPR
jgi:hypothetical protein